MVNLCFTEPYVSLVRNCSVRDNDHRKLRVISAPKAATDTVTRFENEKAATDNVKQCLNDHNLPKRLHLIHRCIFNFFQAKINWI